MTEQEWLTATDSRPMLAYLGASNHRNYCLTKCAFLRRCWHLMTDERSRRAVEVAECYADQSVAVRTLFQVRSDARIAFRQLEKQELARGSIFAFPFSGH